ncbi:hypothetical protein [Paraburkholderia sp. J76]|uniref:hypothetical protein n=1 Tax=Paraburkholderia sp. J76 TaxID=2805439 RepID=UPI002ABE16CC|nr:hypothetical protein [Paraburkholderia sp. J76]
MLKGILRRHAVNTKTSLYGLLLFATIFACGCNRHASAPQMTHAASHADAPAEQSSKQPDSAATSPSLKRTDLMRAVFPGWRDTRQGKERIFDADVPDRDDGGHLAKNFGSERLDIRPREVIRLDDTHAVMLTEGVEIGDDDTPVDSHSSGAWLGAYFFRLDGGRWTLERRIDGTDYAGFMGTYGQSRVVRLSPREFGLLLESGSCWQGYCGSWLNIYDLAPGRVDKLADGIRTAASNLGGKEECEKILKRDGDFLASKFAPHGESTGGSPQCFDVDSQISVIPGINGPGDVTLSFSGSATATNNSSTQVKSVDGVAVYRIENGRYQLVEGSNPVPSF